MSTCKFKWKAPRLRAPGDTQSPLYVEQVCILEEGHEEPHRSLSNVIHFGNKYA